MYVRVSVCALKRSKSHRNVAEMKLSQMAKKNVVTMLKVNVISYEYLTFKSSITLIII